ncbi:lethal(3)malignant brain tumor-like protein 4 isoform X2 [Tubulanus polymorphus]|uniref:lethal(3)malignant brain tumor-like protein 4 isoform X2 n=1 Tax=Tubulanus polymorphus TaxID=672921 RepID=UPI003DA55C2B
MSSTNQTPAVSIPLTVPQMVISQSTPPLIVSSLQPLAKRPRLDEQPPPPQQTLLCRPNSSPAPNFPGGINLTIANASVQTTAPVINQALVKGTATVGTLGGSSLTIHHGPLISPSTNIIKVPNPNPQLNIKGVLNPGMMGQLNIHMPGINNVPRLDTPVSTQQSSLNRTDTTVTTVTPDIPVSLLHSTAKTILLPTVTALPAVNDETLTQPSVSKDHEVNVSKEKTENAGLVTNSQTSNVSRKSPQTVTIGINSSPDLVITSLSELSNDVGKSGLTTPQQNDDPNTVDKEKGNTAVGNSEVKKDEEDGRNLADEEDDDFDMAEVMTWENGIGSLPGSDLKFKINEFGIVEMITEDIDIDDNSTENKAETKNVSEQLTDIKEEPSVRSRTPTMKAKKAEEILRCDNCGVYGMFAEFYHNDEGNFCEESCATMFENKQFLQRKLKEDKEREKKGGMTVKVLPKKKRKGEDLKKSSETPDKPVGKKSRSFSWDSYLQEERAVGINPKLCRQGQAIPITKNCFKVGMRLEGIDPRHPSLYCVLTVAEVKGYRIRLHFDGYSECYDFWVNADSFNIFPVGWCEKNNKTVQPPKGFTTESFSWSEYLKLSKAIAAPRNLFLNKTAASVTPHGFRVGMKLEAIDKTNPVLICVATVADVLADRLLIHFDGWEDTYDYWADPTSPFIKPIGWCLETGRALSPPNDWKDIQTFTWEEYLTKTRSQPVPARAFKSRPPHQFECGSKLEVVDRRNPILIRVATIVDVEDYRLKVHFDGWGDEYDFWTDDDCPDIHPPGWASKTGHPLEPPISPQELASSPSQTGCPTPGCKGLGHIKGARYVGHHSSFGCPYSPLNLAREYSLLDRLGATKIEEGKGHKESPEIKKCPTEGCDGSGHVTGKFTTHHKLSGCPLAEKNQKMIKQQTAILNGEQLPRRPGRPSKKKHKFAQMKHKVEIKEENGDTDVDNNSLYNGIHQSIFMSAMIPNPTKDLPLCWEQHSKILPGVENIHASEVSRWDTENVADFVRSLPGCSEQGQVFQEEQIDGEAFLLLNQTDIVKIMNIKLGPALKIYNSILMFKRKPPS